MVLLNALQMMTGYMLMYIYVKNTEELRSRNEGRLINASKKSSNSSFNGQITFWQLCNTGRPRGRPRDEQKIDCHGRSKN